jgi:hypothetical protein
MSSVQEPHLHLEVGHILFLDIVGYSKLLAEDQKELVQGLNQIVRETEQFRVAEADGKLTRLPTGDGMVLVFSNNPEAPVECALEISKALQSHPKLKVRMGIHSGPINPFADVNDQSNLAGAGINVAQRVMYWADAGHILLSKHFAEDLEQYAHWRAHLHDISSVPRIHTNCWKCLPCFLHVSIAYVMVFYACHNLRSWTDGDTSQGSKGSPHRHRRHC